MAELKTVKLRKGTGKNADERIVNASDAAALIKAGYKVVASKVEDKKASGTSK